MPLYLITGASGSGKSTVCEILNNRGYVAYDADRDHIARWHNKKTKQLVPKQNEQQTSDFAHKHVYLARREIVEHLAHTTDGKPVFLCGNPENEEELQDLFSNKFLLVVDDETWDHRLTTRDNNRWGKLPYQRKFSAKHRNKLAEVAKKSGYTILDATMSPDKVVDTILASLKHGG